MSKKGISLPIEVIVILAIAVFVLVMIFAFFGGGIASPFETTAAQNAWNSGCPLWQGLTYCKTDTTTMATKVPGYTYRGNPGSINDICTVLYQGSIDRCMQACCPGTTGR